MTPKRVDMDKRGEKLPNGEAVREFYASLETIKDYYWNKGYRKKAYLYRTLKEKLGWRMSLESFKYHFKRAIESNTPLQPQAPVSKNSPVQKPETTPAETKVEEESTSDKQQLKPEVEEEFDEETLASMEEYMNNMAHIFEAKKRR